MKIPAMRLNKLRAFTLVEMIVVIAVMSMLTLAVVVLYASALGEFEHATMKSSMNMGARRSVDRITSILSTATARRPTAIPDALYWPDPNDLVNEHSYVDFLSTSPLIRVAANEVSYAFDAGSTLPNYTNVYRYRLAWAENAIANVPRHALYLERLEVNPALGTHITGSARQVLVPQVGHCTFRRTVAGTLQLRLIMYAVDPVTGRGIDGQLMRSQTKRRRTDSTGPDHGKSYELLTAVPLPTLTLR